MAGPAVLIDDEIRLDDPNDVGNNESVRQSGGAAFLRAAFPRKSSLVTD